jgi:hypothetical protein
MTQQECKGCAHSNTCETVYQRMGNSTAPSIAGKIFIVFALPILTFIVTLGLSEKIMSAWISSGLLKLVSGLTALGASVLIVLVSSLLMKSPQRRC